MSNGIRHKKLGIAVSGMGRLKGPGLRKSKEFFFYFHPLDDYIYLQRRLLIEVLRSLNSSNTVSPKSLFHINTSTQVVKRHKTLWTYITFISSGS